MSDGVGSSGAPASTGIGRGRVGKSRTTHASRPEITLAALRLVDEVGVGGLTMRRLGAEVGVTARALYTHFDSRAEVIDSVVDHLWDEAIARIFARPPTDDEWIIAGLLCIRDVFLEHPQVAMYAAAAPKLDDRLRDSIDAFTAIMEMSAFDDRFRAFHLLMQFTMGSIVVGAARRIANDELGRDEEELQRWMAENIGDLREPDEPRARIAKALMPETHDALFEDELRALAASLRSPG